MVQIYSIQSFTGRNIFSHRPVIKMVLNIGDLYDTPTKDIKGFNENLISKFPGLKKHCCSLGYEGGFHQRLNEGTYLAHVTEHLILELQKIMGYDVFYGKTRIVSEPSLYYIVYEYENEKCAIECGKSAVDIVCELSKGNVPDVDAILNNLEKIAAETDLGPSTRAIYNEAKKRGIPITRLGNGSLLQLGYGKFIRLIGASLTDKPSCIAVDIAGNKHLTKQILENKSIPVPFGDIAYSEEAAVFLAREIGYPVVLKPIDGNQGKGVSLNIISDSQVREAFQQAVKFSKAVIVEKLITGKDYRILVIDGKVSAVSERKPPFVEGDGSHSILELIEIKNKNPLRGDDHEKPLTIIKVDSVVRKVLERRGYCEGSIPLKGETVFLRDNGNLSTGGTARNCTEEIHPYNSLIAVKAASALGLDIAGIDMTIEDISIPINFVNGSIVEINAAPGLRMHLFPSEGTPVNVAKDIIDMLFPEEKPYSIPIVAITGTNGKTTTTRLIRHILSLKYKTVGMTSTSGVYVGSECILKGDNTGPISARMVLSNREVEAAVLETARGGIVRKGLGYDLADVGIVVNISEDHIGIDGLNNIEDLAYVKSLVIEAVKPGGYSVLNADDEMIDYLLKRTQGKVALFSKHPNNAMVVNHIKSGGDAVYVEDGIVKVVWNKRSLAIISLEEIPITFGGRVECNVENSLASVSALFSLNIPVEIIRKGLMTFKPDIKTNPGRFNIFDMGDFKIMLDYSHNLAGYSTLAKFLSIVGATRLIGVIGMPGDRLDRSIAEVGELCGKAFSKIYIKEDNDLRGREPGEVAGILYDAAVKNGLKKENIEIIFSELKALECAILDAKPGDMIIMLYENFEPAVELINTFKLELEKEAMLAQLAMEENAV